MRTWRRQVQQGRLRPNVPLPARSRSSRLSSPQSSASAASSFPRHLCSQSAKAWKHQSHHYSFETIASTLAFDVQPMYYTGFALTTDQNLLDCSPKRAHQNVCIYFCVFHSNKLLFVHVLFREHREECGSTMACVTESMCESVCEAPCQQIQA